MRVTRSSILQNLPDGQITKNLSSPCAKNSPVFPHSRDPGALPPTEATLHGVVFDILVGSETRVRPAAVFVTMMIVSSRTGYPACAGYDEF